MIKKAAGIFLILITSMILLAHAVVPHHHHQDEIVILNSHCHEDSDSHHQSANEHQHEHDGSEDTDCCVLKQVAVIISDKVDLKNRSLFVDTLTGFDCLQAILFNSLTNKPFFFNKNLSHLPLIASFYSRILSTSIGLKAPPLG